MSKKEQPENNNNLLYWVIIALLVVIAVLAFFVGRTLGQNSAGGGTDTPATVNNNGEWVTITIIDDKRCTSCGTAEISGQIKQVPFLALAEFEEKDFSDQWVEDFLKENEIAKLPAIIFSTNAIGDGGTMTPFMKPIPNGEYTLEIGSTFDPFEERSDKWFLVLDNETIGQIKSGSYFIGNPNSKIIWIEYTDLGCFYCQKLHEDGTIQTVLESYPETLAKASNHYISVWGEPSRQAAEMLECVGEAAGADAFNQVFDALFAAKKYDEDFVKEEAQKAWVSAWQIDSCMEVGDTAAKVKTEMDTGNQKFGITGTPGNVIINTETGEYEVIPGAYGADRFKEVIDSLM